MRIFCDFDGTIACADTTDLVLARLAPPEWRAIEAAWEAGAIGAAECMRRQIALLRAPDRELNEVLDGVEIDPGFGAFVAWCEARRIPLTIVSDGVDYFIHRVLARHGLQHLPVVTNMLAGDERAGRRLEPMGRDDECCARAGVCKCAVLASCSGGSASTVFVGDGRSDFCVAAEADLLFAKGALARFAHRNGIEFQPFASFHDVQRALAKLDARTQHRSLSPA